MMDMTTEAETHPKVLIIDDDVTIRDLLSDWSADADFDVVGRATTGKQGWKLFQQFDPDITFLDINMPEVDGMQLLKRIREYHRNAFICMVTGESSIETVKKAAALKVSGFLVKPLSKEKFIQVIGTYNSSVKG